MRKFTRINAPALPDAKCLPQTCRRLYWICAFVVASLSPLAAETLPAKPDALRCDRQTFTIAGDDVVLIGGSMHYFRIPEPEWERDFRRMEADGFNIVDTYIPWFVHEPEENQFNFDNLQRFLDLARKHNLYIVARPGPYINSETDQGGFPRWLSGKGVDFRSDSDPSRRWTKHWYDAVMPLLARNQISRGGPVIMVQLENEYGHPQYIGEDEKKSYTRFLIERASAYGLTVPLMGNDMQFAQAPNDPVLAKLYGTVDAYFDSYRGLEEMLQKQRQLNLTSPLGSAEFNLADPAATLRTMLGLGTDYLDLYLLRGGSQFALAARGYESASYEADAPIAEGGYLLPSYYGLRATAMFLRQYGGLVARSEPAPQITTVDDPEIWVTQRNHQHQGFLFVRSDVQGVSERSLALKSLSAQTITYHDPETGEARVIPQSTTMLLRREQSRLMVLNMPVSEGTKVVYSTAELLGRYASRGVTWLVFYGDRGEQAEVALSFQSKPSDLPADALWNDQRREALLRLQFGDSDQSISVGKDLSILVLSRERAYRAKRIPLGDQPALMVSSADETDSEVSGDNVHVQLGLRHSLGPVTILSPRRIERAAINGRVVEVKMTGRAQQFAADVPVQDPGLRASNAALDKSWIGFTPTVAKTVRGLRSLPELGIWQKGVTRYSASLPGRELALRLRFFTDDFKAVYLNRQFVPEVSNRAKESFIPSHYFAGQASSSLEIYYVDTGRPKEDLGLWRLDEKKGLESIDWMDGNRGSLADLAWEIEFAGLDKVRARSAKETGLNVLEYTFPRPQLADWEAVWRVFMPETRGLVYLNGTYVEHHDPHSVPALGRPGIYLPPSLLKNQNQLVLVTFDPVPPDLELPIIRADSDSIRKTVHIELSFAAKGE